MTYRNKRFDTDCCQFNVEINGYTIPVDIRDKDILNQIDNYFENVYYNVDTVNQDKIRDSLDQLLSNALKYCDYSDKTIISSKYRNKIDRYLTEDNTPIELIEYGNESSLIGDYLPSIGPTANLGGSKKHKKKSISKKKKSIPKKKSVSKRKPKVYTGKRGGQYIIKNNRKVYLSSTQ